MHELIDGRFRLEHQLGEGGMGVVFHAVDEHDGRTVAVKLLRHESDADLVRARREAQVLGRLAHPAIVAHVADGITDDGRLYLAMEWIDGITVAERIAGAGFQLSEAVAVLRHVASALAAAHEAQILHRDVKPTNVLLAGGGVDVVKLIDFGVARSAHSSTLTRTGTAIGTPGYMAPEQARGERALTAAADVFGLGSLFYECATGRPAFSGTHRAAVLAKVLFADPVPFAQWCPHAPAALVAVVDRMLEKDPARRFVDGRAVLAAVDALEPIAASVRHIGRSLGAPTAKLEAVGHCVIVVAWGHPDEPLGPVPLADLAAVLSPWAAEGELLDNGVLVVHLTGPIVALARRAARCALALRERLAECSIAISAIEPSTEIAVDGGAALLATSAMAAMFGDTVGQIAIDPRTASLVGDELEVVDGVLRRERVREA